MSAYYYGWKAASSKIGSNYGKLSTAMQKTVRDRKKLVCGLLLLWCAEAACVVLLATISLYSLGIGTPWMSTPNSKKK